MKKFMKKFLISAVSAGAIVGGGTAMISCGEAAIDPKVEDQVDVDFESDVDELEAKAKANKSGLVFQIQKGATVNASQILTFLKNSFGVNADLIDFANSTISPASLNLIDTSTVGGSKVDLEIIFQDGNSSHSNADNITSVRTIKLFYKVTLDQAWDPISSLTPATKIDKGVEPSIITNDATSVDAVAFIAQVDAWIKAAEKTVTNYRVQGGQITLDTFLGLSTNDYDKGYGFAKATSTLDSTLFDWDNTTYTNFENLNLTKDGSGTVDVHFAMKGRPTSYVVRSVTVTYKVDGAAEKFPATWFKDTPKATPRIVEYKAFNDQVNSWQAAIGKGVTKYKYQTTPLDLETFLGNASYGLRALSHTQLDSEIDWDKTTFSNYENFNLGKKESQGVFTVNFVSKWKETATEWEPANATQTVSVVLKYAVEGAPADKGGTARGINNILYHTDPFTESDLGTRPALNEAEIYKMVNSKITKVVHTDYSNINGTMGKGYVWGRHTYAPFVDATLTKLGGINQDPSSQEVNSAGWQDIIDSGVKNVFMGFVQAIEHPAHDTFQLGWAGAPLDVSGGNAAFNEASQNIINGIRKLRNAGGDVAISFGGASGIPPWEVAPSAFALAKEIADFMLAFDVHNIDFDIEGASLAPVHEKTLNLLSNSIALLRNTLDKLGFAHKVTLTLPVDWDGLSSAGGGGQIFLANAYKIAGFLPVNGMTMDYSLVGPMASESMYTRGISATVALNKQMRDAAKASLGLDLTEDQVWKYIGMTPMTGINDTWESSGKLDNNILTLPEYAGLASWADQKDILMFSQWSFNRDHYLKRSSKGQDIYKTHGIEGVEPFAFNKAALQSFGDYTPNDINAVPSVVKNFEVYVATVNSVRLTWNQNPGALYYRIYDAQGNKIGETNNTFIQLMHDYNSAHPGGEAADYTFQISAVYMNSIEGEKTSVTTNISKAGNIAIDNLQAWSPEKVFSPDSGTWNFAGHFAYYKGNIYKARWTISPTDLNPEEAVAADPLYGAWQLVGPLKGYSQKAIDDLLSQGTTPPKANPITEDWTDGKNTVADANSYLYNGQDPWKH